MYQPTVAQSRLFAIAAATVALLVFAACGQVRGPLGGVGESAAPTPTAIPATPVPSVESTHTPAAEEATYTPEEPTPAPEEATPTALPEPSPTQVVDGQGPETPGPTPGVRGLRTGNLWARVLGPTYAPEGWSARPCEGDGFHLCVYEGQAAVGSVELGVYPIDTMPEFQEMLRAAGMISGPVDFKNQAQRAAVTAALRAFVENYHTIFEEDRRLTYRGQATYSRLSTDEVPVGDLPGLRYGFEVLDKEGKVLERWVNHSAFDGEILYTIVGSHHPDTVFTFKSVEYLKRFEPDLSRIVAEMKMPPPVLETDARQVKALTEVTLHRLYTEFTNPVGQLAPGQTAEVTGKSPDDLWWRVVCPAGISGTCWVTADPQKIEAMR